MSGSVSFDTHEFRKALRKLAGDIERAAPDAIADAVQVAFQEAKTTGLFKDRTGRLRGSLVANVRDQKGTISVGRGVAYAHAIHDGSKPHVIVPRNATYLRFKVRGAWVSTKKVNHPGTTPRPFMTRAGVNGGRVLVSSAQARVNAATERFNYG